MHPPGVRFELIDTDAENYDVSVPTSIRYLYREKHLVGFAVDVPGHGLGHWRLGGIGGNDELFGELPQIVKLRSS